MILKEAFMEKNVVPSSIDEMFNDYKGYEHVEDVDWGKGVAKRLFLMT